jgi:predicted permease
VDNLISLFSDNILPIFITAGAGFILGKSIDLDPRTVSRVVFYLFSPCLVFKLLTESELEQSAILQMVAIALSSTIIIGGIAFLISKLLKFNRRMLVAVLLTTMFTNAGNYGLSLNGFAFGKDTLAYASIYFVISASMIYTLGVLIASMGRASLKQAFLGLFRLPTLYALLGAGLFNYSDLTLPLPLHRTIDLLGQAAIPTMLVLLGLQLQRVTWTTNWTALGTANIIRLAIGPLVALGLSALMSLQGPALQAGVTEASMPTAVMCTVLATEYDVEPAFVTTVVTTTTLLSPLTLTPLLALLGG